MVVMGKKNVKLKTKIIKSTTNLKQKWQSLISENTSSGSASTTEHAKTVMRSSILWMISRITWKSTAPMFRSSVVSVINGIVGRILRLTNAIRIMKLRFLRMIKSVHFRKLMKIVNCCKIIRSFLKKIKIWRLKICNIRQSWMIWG